MAKKNGDFNLTVPQADISLEDIPVDLDKYSAAVGEALYSPTPNAKRRAKIFHFFVMAKRNGIAAAANFRARRRSKNAEAEADLAHRINEVLRLAKDRWPDRYSHPPFKAMARELVGRYAHTLRFKAGAIDKILRGKYPAAQRLKIKGLY